MQMLGREVCRCEDEKYADVRTSSMQLLGLEEYRCSDE
jgi:hypothetical protein